MIGSVFRRKAFIRRFLAGAVHIVIAVPLLILEIKTFGNVGGGTVVFDVAVMLATLAFLFFCGIRLLALFFGCLRFGTAGKFIGRYNIDRDELNHDFEFAMRVHDFCIGRKYFVYAAVNPVIIPIDKVVIARFAPPGSTDAEYVSNLSYFVNDSPMLKLLFRKNAPVFDKGKNIVIDPLFLSKDVLCFVDDTTKSISFRVRHMDEGKEILNAIHEEHPEILTPLDEEFMVWFKEYQERYSYAFELVEKRRKKL